MDGTQVYLQKRTDGKRRHEAEDKSKFLVAMRLGDTPVPIPNTMVKT